MGYNIKVGYGRMDMMPAGPIELGGLGNGHMRVMENALDTLYITCVAITDEQEQTLLLLELDIVKLNDDWVAQMRGVVSAATGVPEDHIMIAASHSHSAPEVKPFDKRVERVARYMDHCNENAAKAALMAMEDRKSAKIYGGVSELDGMTFVRHYWCADGSCAARGTKDNPAVRHTADADSRMQLVRFEREGGKDIIVMNWQAHATFTGLSYRKDLSADYIAPVRNYMELMADCHYMFLQGAGGNLTGTSKIADEKQEKDMVQYGRKLGEAAMAMLPDLKPLKAGPIRILRRDYEGRVDHTLDYRLEEAKDVWAFWRSNGKIAEVWPYAQARGFATAFAAQGVLLRYDMPRTMTMELNAISVGELALATMPGEVFDTCGAQVKDRSPYPLTLMLSLCNGYHDYFPNHHAYSYGCYETTCCYYEEGTCEELADLVTEMLGSLEK